MLRHQCDSFTSKTVLRTRRTLSILFIVIHSQRSRFLERIEGITLYWVGLHRRALGSGSTHASADQRTSHHPVIETLAFSLIETTFKTPVFITKAGVLFYPPSPAKLHYARKAIPESGRRTFRERTPLSSAFWTNLRNAYVASQTAKGNSIQGDYTYVLAFSSTIFSF